MTATAQPSSTVPCNQHTVHEPELHTNHTRAYTVPPDSSLFAAAEKAIDNGTHMVFVTGPDGVLQGCVTLQRLRKAILDGEYLHRVDIREFIEPPPHDGVITAVLDSLGRLVDVSLRQNAKFVPVAEPMLSHREFRYLVDAYLSTWISSTGDYIRRFEHDFATRFGLSHGIATSNGTVSLHLALQALDVGPGDEVIVPDFTFAASANAVLYCGATPVFVDVDAETWCMTPDTFRDAITPRTKVVMPVHVFGRVAPMVHIAELARHYGIHVVEDCAEAHGAAYDGRYIGQFSTIASFSFFANKIITSGEGGMCVTQSSELAARMRLLRDHGMAAHRRYWHEEVGFNYRMTNMQAAVGLGQLERIDELLAVRRRLADRYAAALSGIRGVSMAPQLGELASPVIWFVCATVPPAKRASLIQACKNENIDLRPFFHNLSAMPAYKRFAKDNPVAAQLAMSGVNLPTSHRIDDAIVATVANIFYRVLELEQ
jgi:perosamine synthetase